MKNTKDLKALAQSYYKSAALLEERINELSKKIKLPGRKQEGKLLLERINTLRAQRLHLIKTGNYLHNYYETECRGRSPFDSCGGLL
jgi:hypothetical protein